MSNVGDEFTGTVSSLAFGGQGIVRSSGLVIFVPFSAPGDIIEGKITAKKKQFAVGAITNLITPSRERTTPLCPYFGTCGGCQLQHLAQNAQLIYKKEAVEDALQRIGNLPNAIVNDPIPSPTPWAYRRHIKLHLRPFNGHYQIGYFAIDNTTLMPVKQCPIFTVTDPILQQVQDTFSTLLGDGGQGEATIVKLNENRYLIAVFFDKIPSNAIEVMDKAIQTNKSWSGISIRTPSKTLQWGENEAIAQIDGLSFKFAPDAFIQNHPEQSLNIYHAMINLAKKNQPKRVLDLYCGIGISSILMAREGFSVTGVESNPKAIGLAQENALLNKIALTTFIQADVKKILAKLLKREKPDLVIVNPPRGGLDPSVIRSLIACCPKEIIYISCMPSTLARDLRELCKESYLIKEIQPYDMFPQTAHVETLVHLKKCTA